MRFSTTSPALKQWIRSLKSRVVSSEWDLVLIWICFLYAIFGGIFYGQGSYLQVSVKLLRFINQSLLEIHLLWISECSSGWRSKKICCIKWRVVRYDCPVKSASVTRKRSASEKEVFCLPALKVVLVWRGLVLLTLCQALVSKVWKWVKCKLMQCSVFLWPGVGLAGGC